MKRTFASKSSPLCAIPNGLTGRVPHGSRTAALHRILSALHA